MYRRFQVVAAVVAAILVTNPSYALTPDELIQQVAKGESRLTALRASGAITNVSTGQRRWEGEWAREGVKGFLRGKTYYYDDGKETALHDMYAFDGEQMYTFQEESFGGTIRALGAELDSVNSPGVLLGQAIKHRDRYTLADCLQEAEHLEILSTESRIEGRPCIEVAFTVVGFLSLPDGSEEPYQRASKVWLDRKRDYRPLRIENYNSSEVLPLGECDSRGTGIRQVVDHIRLEQVQGHWLPVSGTVTYYTKEKVILDGYTRVQLEAMPPKEAAQHTKSVRVIAQDDGPWRIDVKGWDVSDSLDPGLFKIVFPSGSYLVNKMLGVSGYVGGMAREEVSTVLGRELGTSQIDVAASDDLVERQHRTSSDSPAEGISEVTEGAEERNGIMAIASLAVTIALTIIVLAGLRRIRAKS